MSNVLRFPNQVDPAHFFSNAGWVYVLSNPAMPGIVKIGRTTSDVSGRMRQLFSTGVPASFACLFAEWFADSQQAERFIHAHLEALRLAASREFFIADVRAIQNAFMTYAATGESIPDSMVDVYALRRHQQEHETKINGTLIARVIGRPASTEVPF